MYVLVNNGYVINGPRTWNNRSFENTLSEELDISLKLPQYRDSLDIIQIDENTTIYHVELQQPNYNPKTQYPHGPFWDYSTGIAIGTYEVLDKPVDHVKAELKLKLADNRYLGEISGITIDLQGISIKLDTCRNNSDVFLQRYILMADTDTISWKFSEGWLTLSKIEVKSIVDTIHNFVQSQFDWENSKIQEIDSLETLIELDELNINNPVITSRNPYGTII